MKGSIKRLHQKTRIPDLPGDENPVILWSLVLSRYQRVTDRQTDGRTDGHATDSNVVL